MKIDNTSAVQLNAYLKQVRNQQQQPDSRTQAEQGKPVVGSDKVELSQQAKEAQQAMQNLKTMPEVRSDKVEQVKMEIEKGTYKVMGAKVAPKMLKESFENDWILQKVNSKV